MNFSQTVGPHQEEKDRDTGLRLCGKGSGRAGNWNGKIQSIFSVKSPSLGQLGPVWPGPVQLCGCTSGQQMHGRMVCCEVPAIFLFSWLSFSSNMIVSSPIHTWQNRARFSLNCPESLSLFLFFFLYKRIRPDCLWRCFWRKPARNRKPRGQKTETAHNRYSPSFGDVASATSSSSLTLNIKCVFFIVFVRAHIGRQVFSQLHHEPWTLLYMDM